VEVRQKMPFSWRFARTIGRFGLDSSEGCSLVCGLFLFSPCTRYGPSSDFVSHTVYEITF